MKTEYIFYSAKKDQTILVDTKANGYSFYARNRHAGSPDTGSCTICADDGNNGFWLMHELAENGFELITGLDD